MGGAVSQGTNDLNMAGRSGGRKGSGEGGGEARRTTIVRGTWTETLFVLVP